MKSTAERFAGLVKLIQESTNAYWCNWCGRHIRGEVVCNSILFVHDDVPHPKGWKPDCGGTHRLQ